MTEQDQPADGASPPPTSYEQYRPPAPSVTHPPAEVEVEEAEEAEEKAQPHPDFSYGPPAGDQLSQSHLLVGDSSGGGGTRTTKRNGGILGVVGLLVAGAVGVGAFGAVQDARDTFDSFSETLSNDPLDVFSVSGYADLVDAVRTETGSTDVFDLVLYPEYAVITVPAGDSGGRALSYFWDGDLQQTSKSTSSDTRFDLEVIDPEVVIRLVKKARRQLVDDPTSSYVIIRSPRDAPDGAWLSAYASNEFSENGYLAATLDGTIVFRYSSVTPSP